MPPPAPTCPLPGGLADGRPGGIAGQPPRCLKLPWRERRVVYLLRPEAKCHHSAEPRGRQESIPRECCSAGTIGSCMLPLHRACACARCRAVFRRSPLSVQAGEPVARQTVGARPEERLARPASHSSVLLVLVFEGTLLPAYSCLIRGLSPRGLSELTESFCCGLVVRRACLHRSE